MLASSSRSCIKRVRFPLYSATKTESLTNALASNWFRHASSVAVHTNNEDSSSGPRYKPEFPSDVSHQKTMNRTTQARSSMQMMAEATRRNYPACLEIAADMKAQGIRPDLTTYSSLMEATAHGGGWFEAWAILDDMLLVGVKPDINILNNLIFAQRSRTSQNIWYAMETIKKLKLKPNARTSTLIIERFATDGNMEMALQYFYAMKRQSIIPEVQAAEAVINVIAQRGYPRLALDIAAWYEENSIRRLNHSTWMNCLISSADRLYVDGVNHCWKLVVQELKIMPDEGLCLSVLRTAARHGLPDLATEVLRALKVIGLPWKEHHFAPLIEAFCRENQLKEAILTLDIMRSSDIEPTSQTAYPILDTIKHDVDAVDATWAIIDKLHEEGKSIHIIILNALIQASVLLSDLQRAIGAYKSFPDYGITPNIATFNRLLQGCVSAKHRDLGDLLLSDLQQAKLKPDQRTYQLFISLCLTQADYEDAFFYLEEMKAAGFKPPSSVYEELVETCISAGDSRYTIALEEMQETGYDVSPRLMRRVRGIKNSRDTTVKAQTEEVQPVALDGAAQRFIETGGLAGAERLGETPHSYVQEHT